MCIRDRVGAAIISVIGLIGVGFVIVTSFFPPASLKPDEHAGYILFILLGTILLTAIPLLIYRFRKPSWKVAEERTDASVAKESADS